MILLFSSIVSIVIFSIAFIAIPMKIKARNKLILVLLSIICYVIGEITWLLFVWWLSVLIILLFILCITILIGAKVQWIESTHKSRNFTSKHKEIKVTPMFSYEELIEKSASAENLDLGNNDTPLSFNMVAQEETNSSMWEVAVSTDKLKDIDLTNQKVPSDEVINSISTDTSVREAMYDIASNNSITENPVKRNDEDLQQILKNRQNLLKEIESTNSIIQPLNTLNRPQNLEMNLQANDIANDDLQLLYKRIREEEKAGS